MKSLRKSTSFLIMTILTAVATIALSGLINHNGLERAFGDEQTYTITLSATTGTLTANSNEGYKTDSYGPINTSSSNPISYAFVDGMKSTTANTLGQLKASTGTFYNTTAITGIKSITVNYSSTTNMKLYLGTSANPSANNSTLTSGAAITSSGAYSYFKVMSGSSFSTVTSIIIQYSCVIGSGSSDTSSSSSEDSSSDTSGEVGGNQYSLVTSAAQLTIGDSYLITATSSSAYYAAGALSSAYLTSVSITSPVSNIITIGSESVTSFVLGGTSGAYTLTSAAGQLYSSAAKNINYSSDGSGTWAITISGSTATIQNTTSSYGSLQYNSGAPRFTTYTSAQVAVALYKSSSSAPSVTLSSISVTTPPTKTAYVTGESLDLTGLVVTATFSDSSTEVINGSSYSATPANGSILSTVGTTTITISYTYVGVTKTTTTAVSVSAPATVNVTGVTLDQSTLELDVNETATLTQSVAPSNATNKSVNWSSTNPSVASVSSSGLVTALTAGSATITVTTVDQNKTASCEVTVTAVSNPASSYRIQFLTTGTSDSSTEYTTASLLSSGITAGSAYVSSVSAVSKAYPGNGGVKLGSSSAAGSFTLALSNSGKVTARKIVVSAKKYSSDSTSISVNSSTSQSVTDANYKEYEFAITGAITTLNVAGTGKRFYINYIDVFYGEQENVTLTSVVISKSTLSLAKDATSTLTASYTPTNVYPAPSLAWSTENASIATVSGGVVTGKGEGTTNIVATATQGATVVTASCAVTVTIAANYTVKTMAYDYQDYMNNNYYSNMDSMPTTETVNLLVIPVQLSTGTTMTADTRSRIQKAYFGTEAETGWHSVSSFYNEESNGRINITGVVSPIYNASYGATITQAQTTTLVTTATNWYKTNYSTNSGKEFDSNSDGYIDGVILIYSAENNYGGNDNLWAYCYWTSVNANTSSPVANTYFWASYDFMNESDNCSIDAHTYIHETGHVMGLDDYYNYDSASSYGAAGGFNMQDFNVGEHDPYSRVALGWIDPIVPTGSTTLTIAPGQAVILSPNDLSSNSPFDEYLILDVYSPTGLNEFDSTYKYGSMYPKGPSVTGIRVWHVDARLMRNYSGSGVPTLATTISSGNDYYHAMSNSTNSTYGSMYSGYRSYKLLHLLQCGGTNTYATGGQFAAADIWTVGKSFSMSSYASFFVNSGKLNSNTDLPYSFSVTAINGTNVTISIVKN